MNNQIQHGTPTATTSLCLGHPAHALQPEERICRICGTLATGAQIGPYRLQQSLGTGRSGHAYLAVHQRSGQPVAIKLLPPDFTGSAQQELWGAARREVRAITALRHSAILPVFSCGAWHASAPQSTGGLSDSFQYPEAGPERRSAPAAPQQGEYTPQTRRGQVEMHYGNESYLLTLCQYVPFTLPHFVAHYQRAEHQRALLEQGTTMLALLGNVIQQMGSALSAAHARGIAHGALVPGNLLFSSHERVWVADFGLARLHPPPTPYLPPEFYNASNAGTLSDNAHTYWQAATPAGDQYMLAILCQQLLAQLLRPEEYAHMAPIFQRAMQPRPERRYQSVDLFVHDLVTLTRRAPAPQFPTRDVRAREHTKRTDPAHTPLPLTPMVPLTPMTPINYAMAISATPAPVSMAISQSSTPLAIDDWEKRGDKLFTLHEYEEALQAYHRALEQHANRAVLWLALGDTYFALERYKEALMAYEQAMYLNPNDPQAWSNRGTVLDVLGRHQEALDCYERAEQLR